ncbi:hypothetical protein [uncultured Clostridium sp.]|uniref:hypothetical protein n=1 Tax=uncultured Clostridium sp. TaxID=59620 RepID=UPI0028E26B17|nr:hypothetical protein [uncultured Clostridium sp.]
MKPILFNTEMVQAILEGRKTTTRRVIKVDKDLDLIGYTCEDGCEFNKAAFGKGSFKKLLDAKIEERIKVPYMPGEVLYVRETWGITNPIGDFARNNMTAEYMYKAGYAKGKRIPITQDKEKNLGVWKPSIHMPKDAARIFLKVTDVRVERLQDIDCETVQMEGIKVCDHWLMGWMDLWNSTLKKDQLEQYGFNANPYVWVIEFERCEKPNER